MLQIQLLMRISFLKPLQFPPCSSPVIFFFCDYASRVQPFLLILRFREKLKNKRDSNSACLGALPACYLQTMPPSLSTLFQYLCNLCNYFGRNKMNLLDKYLSQKILEGLLEFWKDPWGFPRILVEKNLVWLSHIGLPPSNLYAPSLHPTRVTSFINVP